MTIHTGKPVSASYPSMQVALQHYIPMSPSGVMKPPSLAIHSGEVSSLEVEGGVGGATVVLTGIDTTGAYGGLKGRVKHRLWKFGTEGPFETGPRLLAPL